MGAGPASNNARNSGTRRHPGAARGADSAGRARRRSRKSPRQLRRKRAGKARHAARADHLPALADDWAVRRRARRHARRTVGALMRKRGRRTEIGCARNNEKLLTMFGEGCNRSAHFVGDRLPPPRRRPAAADCRRRMARRNSDSTARRQRLRLRPAVLCAGIRPDRRRTRRHNEKPHIASRSGLQSLLARLRWASWRWRASSRSPRRQKAKGERLEFRSQPPCRSSTSRGASKMPLRLPTRTQARERIPEDDYIAALIADLESALLRWSGAGRIATVFIGGGTPKPALRRRHRHAVVGGSHTHSAAARTPKSRSKPTRHGRSRSLRGLSRRRRQSPLASASRASIRHLQALGRIHDGREARQAIELAVRHFDPSTST